MTPPTRVKDLFDLPERIHKGDFVLKLADGIASPAETARSHVVTAVEAINLKLAVCK